MASSGFTDRYADFNEAEGDRIDLSAIDADLLAAGDQAFTPIGTEVAFNGIAAELRFNGGFLEGDVNGDAVTDFRIELTSRSCRQPRSSSSGSIPKFANTRGTFSCELWNQRATSNSMVLAPF